MEIVHRVRQELASRIARGPSRRSRLPPGPGTPSLLQLAAFLYEPRPFLEGARAAHGDIITLRLPSMFTLIQVNQPEHVKAIFRLPSDVAHAGEANAVLEPFLGPHSLLMLDGERHLRHRRLMLPPFRGERMRAYGDAMQSLTEESMARWPVGRTFALQDHTQQITLDVIIRTVFGLGDEATALRASLQKTLSLLDDPMYVVRFAQHDLGPWSPWGKYLRLRATIQRELLGFIRARREATDLDERSDILSMLLLATDETGAPLSDDEVHDELITMLIAGHETTATALSWTFHRLTQHPQILAKVFDEVDVTSAEDAGERTAHPYLDAVIKETLRIHPVIPGIGRVLQEPMELAGYTLPKGSTLACSILLAHFNERVWPEPDRFDPTRFLPGGAATKPTAYTYFPFGGGTRRCIGEAFALFEMRIVLATVLRKLRPVAAPGVTIRTARRNITLSPSDRMPIVFHDRR